MSFKEPSDKPRYYIDPIIETFSPYDINEKRFEYIDVDDIKNAIEITLKEEDHTVGNLIRTSLINDPRVQFAGYSNPHPLENKIIIKLKLYDDVDIKPLDLFIEHIEILKSKINKVQDEFERAYDIFVKKGLKK
jgi:DNA-directed RNA polymerase II subunit RPB11